MTATITETLNVVTAGLFVILAIEVVYLSVRSFRIWRERRAAAKAPRAQQLIWRGDLIGALIQMVGQDTRPTRRLSRLRRVLGWTHGQALLVLDSLTEKGLVDKGSLGAASGEPFETLGSIIGGVRVRLTEAGLEEAERAERGPTENLPRIVAYRSTVTISGRDAVVGSPGAHARDTAIESPAAYSKGLAIESPGATQTLIEHGIDPDLLKRWIEMYRQALGESTSLSEGSVRHAASLLDDLEEAAAAGDTARMNSLGQTLRAIAEGVAGNAAFAAIVAVAERFPFGS